MILFRCLSCSLENLPTDILRCPRCEGEFFVPDPKTTLEPEPRFSDETTKPTTEVNERTLPEIQNTFGHTYSLNAQDKDKFNPSRYNFIPDPLFLSTVERHPEINFSDPPPSKKCKIGNFAEMMIQNKKSTESSRIENIDGEMSFAGSSQFEPHTSMLPSYPESANLKLQSTGNQGNSSTLDLLNKMGNSSNSNILSDEVESVNELAQQEAHTSNPQTRKEAPENACAILPMDSSASTSYEAWRCGRCPRWFKRESAFNVHVQNNCDPNPYRCDKCPVKYTFDYQLINHERLHTGDKPHECVYCDYASNRKDNLKRHIKSQHININNIP